MKAKKQALEEMRNVSKDKELGNWSEAQRAIVGAWASWIDKDTEAQADPVKKQKGKIESFIDNTLASVVIALVCFFFYHGGMWFQEQRKQDTDVSRSIDKDVTCYSYLASVSCLPNWLIDLRIKKSDLVDK